MGVHKHAAVPRIPGTRLMGSRSWHCNGPTGILPPKHPPSPCRPGNADADDGIGVHLLRLPIAAVRALRAAGFSVPLGLVGVLVQVSADENPVGSENWKQR